MLFRLVHEKFHYYRHILKVKNFVDECNRHNKLLEIFLFTVILTFTSSLFSNDAIKIGNRSHSANYERAYFSYPSTYLFSVIYNFCPFYVKTVACLSFQHLFQTSNGSSKFLKSRLSVLQFSFSTLNAHTSSGFDSRPRLIVDKQILATFISTQQKKIPRFIGIPLKEKI